MASGNAAPSLASAEAGELRVSHVSRHLVSISTVLRERISEGLADRGHDLTPSVSTLVPNLPAEGLGMSALAARAGISLQRGGQLVAQLEADGYVRRVTDEQDGRARRVVYTRRGRKLLRDIDGLLDEIAEELAALLGAERFDRLVHDLAVLDASLGSPDGSVRLGADPRLRR